MTVEVESSLAKLNLATEVADSKTILDHRPLISDLLKKHGDKIEEVRNIIKEESLYNKDDNAKRYDDIWILRFVLSHKKNVKSAAKAAIKTMQYREEWKLNEMGDIRHKFPSQTAGDDQWPFTAAFNTNSATDDCMLHTQPDDNRGIITYIRLQDLNQQGLYESTTIEDMKQTYIYLNECIFQVHDAVTRKTGRLTKHLRIVDMGNLGFRDMHMKYLKRDGEASKYTEDFYPQALGAIVAVNAPVWVSGIWKIARPFFPSRFAEKVNISGSKISSKDTEFFLKFISKENLPVSLGGSNKEWPIEDVASKYSKK